jgi:WD40 repeat protein
LTITDVSDENKRKIALLLSEYGAVCSNNELQEIVNTTMSRVMTFTGHYSPDWGYVPVAYSPDGTQIVSGANDDRILLWDAVTGQIIREFSDLVRSIAFSPDGRYISGSSDKITLWDVSTGSLIRTFPGQREVVSIAFSPDGRQIVSGSQDRTIKLWDIATGQEIWTISEHKDRVSVVAFSPDGNQILSGGYDDRILLWSAATGQLIREFTRTINGISFNAHRYGVEAAAFSLDGAQVVSSSYDNDIKLWDTATGQEIWNSPARRSEFFTSVAFSPDGTQIVSVSLQGITLWDTSTGKVNSVFNERGSNSVAFSPDGRYIAVGSTVPNRITIWDTTIVR